MVRMNTPTTVQQHHPTQGEEVNTNTIDKLVERHSIDVLDHLERDLDIPILTGLQRQGDVIVVPDPKAKATTPVPAAGVPVVRGENGGNTHAIVADGPGVTCDVRRASADALTLATLDVPTGSVAWLAHPEHGYMGIGAGTYTLRRQREQADELRMVQD
jgi:hypothetical protein